ncbi:hypothetical protein SteCoe_7307 [Stentor coeruleus]|uniref:Ribosome production factor 2 homolog n=1 Tax=Stentor coeruleus TaxID=5963 RepID=A0A1R2CMZ9_9CILI|nr:hypothetical protein SteCoe_7307 [Stentor coeruleus]
MVKSIEKKKEEGELIETLPKVSVIMKGTKASPEIAAALIMLHKFRLPDSLLLSKRHENLFPFENSEVVESFLSPKGASLYVIGSNSKKRPSNLIFGRLFDEQTLDLVEFHLTDYEELPSKSVFHPGQHPILMFQGEGFETDYTLARVKNIFLDFFGGRALTKVDTRGIDKLITFTVTQDQKIHFRCYQLPEVKEIFCKFTLTLRRSRIADPEKFKEACKDPKLMRKKKNIKTNALKEKRGQVHVQQQEISTIALKKRKPKIKPET